MLPLRATRQSLQRAKYLRQQYQYRRPLQLLTRPASTVASVSNGETSAQLTPPPPPGKGDQQQHLQREGGQSQLSQSLSQPFLRPLQSWQAAKEVHGIQVPWKSISGPSSELVHPLKVPGSIPGSIPETKSQTKSQTQGEKYGQEQQKQPGNTQEPQGRLGRPQLISFGSNQFHQPEKAISLADHSGDTIIMTDTDTTTCSTTSTTTPPPLPDPTNTKTTWTTCTTSHDAACSTNSSTATANAANAATAVSSTTPSTNFLPSNFLSSAQPYHQSSVGNNRLNSFLSSSPLTTTLTTTDKIAAQRSAQLARHFSSSPSHSFEKKQPNSDSGSTTTSSSSTMAYSVRKVAAPNTLEHRVYIEKDGVPVSPFHDVPLYANQEQTILNMIVEIPRWTNAKLEVSLFRSPGPQATSSL